MNSDTAIRVEGLSKRYRLGENEKYHMLRDSIRRAVSVPWNRLARGGRSSANGAARHEKDQVLWALRDISFDVPCGTILGIIGRNGAGKSTILKVLSRITEPTAGQAKIRGRVGSLLEVGTGFHPELTGRENIYVNGAILGMSRAEITRKFDEIVGFAGVERFLDTPLKRYSSGMNVRLAFAVAAYLEPEILLIDEVLAVGDAEFQEKCLGRMSDVARHGRTVIFVSHDMAAIEGLCTRVLLLDSGRIVTHGSPAAVIPHYLQTAFETQYDVDLSAHSGRPASSRPIFQRLRLLDDGGCTLSAIGLGDPVTFELQLGSDLQALSTTVAIHLHNLWGQRVVTFQSDYQYAGQIRLRTNTVLRCRTPSWRLLSGRYSIVLELACDDHVVDRIDPCTQIDVIERDCYGTGKSPPGHNGVFAPEAHWEVAQEAVSGARRDFEPHTHHGNGHMDGTKGP